MRGSTYFRQIFSWTVRAAQQYFTNVVQVDIHGIIFHKSEVLWKHYIYDKILVDVRLCLTQVSCIEVAFQNFQKKFYKEKISTKTGM
jgi:hypothetical protein